MDDHSPEAFRLAPSGEGPHAYNWADKPHRVLYDAAAEIARLTALVAELRQRAEAAEREAMEARKR